jgi:hypothetical protein
MKQSLLKSVVVFLMALVMMLSFVGVAFATSTITSANKIVDRAEYSTALNSVATVAMNWYGSLISVDENDTESLNFKSISKQWGEYRSQYPENISQIFITSTELLKLEGSGNYQFRVKSKIAYKQEHETITQLLNETFVFKSTLLNHKDTPFIESISRDKSKVTNNVNNNVNTTGFDISHYKVREFTYAWLSYIDGINTLKTTMNAKAWLDKATYSLKMGSDQSMGSIESTLEKKKLFLTKGGHLLHSLEVKQSDANTFVIDLILGWKGINKVGKSVVARIHQEIEVKINTDKTWEVLSVKEEHLLPIIAPWMGLVC